jgi:hypothetical protein
MCTSTSDWVQRHHAQICTTQVRSKSVRRANGIGVLRGPPNSYQCYFSCPGTVRGTFTGTKLTVHPFTVDFLRLVAVCLCRSHRVRYPSSCFQARLQVKPSRPGLPYPGQDVVLPGDVSVVSCSRCNFIRRPHIRLADCPDRPLRPATAAKRFREELDGLTLVSPKALCDRACNNTSTRMRAAMLSSADERSVGLKVQTFTIIRHIGMFIRVWVAPVRLNRCYSAHQEPHRKVRRYVRVSWCTSTGRLRSTTGQRRTCGPW